MKNSTAALLYSATAIVLTGSVQPVLALQAKAPAPVQAVEYGITGCTLANGDNISFYWSSAGYCGENLNGVDFHPLNISPNTQEQCETVAFEECPPIPAPVPSPAPRP